MVGRLQVLGAVFAASMTLALFGGGAFASRPSRPAVRLGPLHVLATDSAPSRPVVVPGSDVVVDRWGTVTVGFVEGDTLRFARRHRSGSWSGPVTVGCKDQPSNLQGRVSCWVPAMAVDGAGTVTAVWDRETRVGAGSIYDVQVAWRPRGGAWHGPVTLTDTRRWEHGANPGVVAARNGTVLVTFEVDNPRRPMAGEAVVYKKPGVGWARAARIEVRAWAPVASAISDSGTALVVGQGQVDPPSIKAVQFTPWRGQGKAVVIGHGSMPAVAMGPGGRAVAAWDAGVVRARMMSRHGRWRPPRSLGPSTGSGALFAAMDVHGRAVVAWGADNKSFSATKRGAGVWTRATIARSPELVRLAANRNGDLAVIWDRWPNRGPITPYIALQRYQRQWSSSRLLPDAMSVPDATAPAVAVRDGTAWAAYVRITQPASKPFRWQQVIRQAWLP